MKVYKNPFVSRESYFVKTGKAHSYKNEASKSNGYIVEFIGGKWELRDGCYNDLVEFAEDVAYQFGYYCQNKGRLHITHGGLSTLERAFDILGWENPHPVPECECEIDGCHEHATCGTPTKDGYKIVCGKHFTELQKEA